MFNTNNNNITTTATSTTLFPNVDNTVPAQNQPQYARYSVSHTDMPPSDPQFNQFTKGFSIFNNNMMFTNNNGNNINNTYNNSQSYQNQQTSPSFNQDTSVFNAKYRLSSISSIPSSIANTNNNNNNSNNINLNDLYLNKNNSQNNIVFNSSIFNSNQSNTTDNYNHTYTGNNIDNNINMNNGGELFNASLNTILDTSLNTGSNLNFIKSKRKSSILFMDPNDLKSFDWNYPTTNNTNGNNNSNLLTFDNSNLLNNEKSSSIILKDLDSNKLFVDSNSSSNTITSTSTNITANTDDIDPLCTQIKDFIKLNPYGSFSNFTTTNNNNNNSSNSNNIIVEKSRSSSYSKRNSSLNNLLFGDKMTIPVVNTESIDNYLESNNSDKTTSPTTTATTDNLNILSPVTISPLLNKQNLVDQTNNKRKEAAKKNKNANVEELTLIKDEQVDAKTPFYDRSETPLGETRIDQLMLMLQARQKGVTDEIKTDKEGELLLDENPNIVPDKKVLAGGITKRKDRDILTISPIQKDIILSRPISRNQNDSESILSGLSKSDPELNNNNIKIDLEENIDQEKIISNIPVSPNIGSENKLNVGGLSNFFNIDELSSDEKQMVNRNICPYCQHVFKQLTHLQVHLRSHLGYKPFKCRFCEKRFTQGGNLRTHEKLHTGLRPYECHICKRKFSRKGNLKAHMFTHNDTKPFICKLENCNKTFTQLGNMKAHQNRFHKDTVLHLTNILAKWNPQTDDMPEHDRQLLEYFASLYKNSNKGIKGRGKGNANIKLIPGLDQDNTLLSTNSEEENGIKSNNNITNSIITTGSTNINVNNQVSPLQSMNTNPNFNNLEGSHMSITYKDNTSNYTTTPKNNNLSNSSKELPAGINPKTGSASTFLPMMISKFKNSDNDIKFNNQRKKNNDIDINGLYQETFDKNNININMVKPSTAFPDYFLLDDINSNDNTARLNNENDKNMFLMGKVSTSIVPNTTEVMTGQKRNNNASGRSNTNKRKKKKSLRENETSGIISTYDPSVNINSQSIDFKKFNYKT